MNNRELLEAACSAAPVAFMVAFKRRVLASIKVHKYRAVNFNGYMLAHWDCDRRARAAAAYARNNSTKYAAQTPEQAYDRVYEARAELYLQLLAEVMQPLLCADQRQT